MMRNVFFCCSWALHMIHISRGRVSTNYELPPRQNIVTRAHMY